MPIAKECIICHERYPIEEFYRSNCMKDGYLNKCKSCTRKGKRIREENRVADEPISHKAMMRQEFEALWKIVQSGKW